VPHDPRPVIHWLLVALVVDGCMLVLVLTACTPYLRRRNSYNAYMHRVRCCPGCGHVVEGYTFDEMDYREQLHMQTAHAALVTRELVEAA
jgi:hypothetical protein